MFARRSLAFQWLAVTGMTLLSIVLMVGCNSSRSSSSTVPDESKPLRVVATVGMVADLVREIGGDQVQVQQLMGIRVDPHLYRPTRDDTIAIRNADMVFYSGLKLEGKMSDILGKGSQQELKDRKSFAVTASIPQDLLFKAEDFDHADPHVWMDVSMWKLAAKEVLVALQAKRPKHTEAFRERFEKLESQLEGLDQYGLKVIATIPKEKRLLITSHDAFRYFGRRYGIEVGGVQGISTDSEAGLKRIRELVDLIVERKIGAVFIESSVSKDSIEALVRGAADRGQKVEIGGPLFSDAMGEENSYEGTYIGMLDHNISIVAKMLGGQVPEGGYRGTN